MSINVSIWIEGIGDPVIESSLGDFGGILPNVGDLIFIPFVEMQGIREREVEGDYFRVINRSVRLNKHWVLTVEPISEIGFNYRRLLS